MPQAVLDFDWMLAAACRGHTDLFFAPDESESRAERRRREANAKTVCNACEVRVDCLKEALEQEERFGIWGGLTERERRAFLRSCSGEGTSPQDIAAGPGRLARLPAVVVQGRAMSFSTQAGSRVARPCD
ncbi:MAG: WhiB family transcriptional regulator [Actinomycetota bacterium]